MLFLLFQNNAALSYSFISPYPQLHPCLYVSEFRSSSLYEEAQLNTTGCFSNYHSLSFHKFTSFFWIAWTWILSSNRTMLIFRHYRWCIRQIRGKFLKCFSSIVYKLWSSLRSDGMVCIAPPPEWWAKYFPLLKQPKLQCKNWFCPNRHSPHQRSPKRGAWSVQGSKIQKARHLRQP